MTYSDYEEECLSSSEEYYEGSSHSEYDDVSAKHKRRSHQQRPIRILDRWPMHFIKEKKDDYAEVQRSRPPSRRPSSTSRPMAHHRIGISQTPKESFDERLKKHAELYATDPRRSR